MVVLCCIVLLRLLLLFWAAHGPKGQLCSGVSARQNNAALQTERGAGAASHCAATMQLHPAQNGRRDPWQRGPGVESVCGSGVSYARMRVAARPRVPDCCPIGTPRGNITIQYNTTRQGRAGPKRKHNSVCLPCIEL